MNIKNAIPAQPILKQIVREDPQHWFKNIKQLQSLAQEINE